jgi:hypothetical protein
MLKICLYILYILKILKWKNELRKKVYDRDCRAIEWVRHAGRKTNETDIDRCTDRGDEQTDIDKQADGWTDWQTDRQVYPAMSCGSSVLRTTYILINIMSFHFLNCILNPSNMLLCDHNFTSMWQESLHFDPIPNSAGFLQVLWFRLPIILVRFGFDVRYRYCYH